MIKNKLYELLPLFAEHLKNKGRSLATIFAYKADIEQLIEYLNKNAKTTPTQVTKEDIDNFRDTLLRRKYVPKSVSRKLNAIKTFFKWLLDNKYITKNVSEYVEHPKVNVEKPKFMSPLEYRALRDASRDDERTGGIIELILQTGLRISEISNLKCSNISDKEILIEAYATQPSRKVPLNKRAKEAIERYKKVRPETKYPHFFVSKSGKPLAVRNIRASIDRYMQKAEIQNFSVNDLRTTFIVENLKAGVDVILISQVSGHKRISTTEKYLEIIGIKDRGKKQELIEL
ncbi:MAG: tyrosine-type recombinase/integrase [Patescibacteria group bacterium]|nr:tyrosine-type recombinase/integrase [Patescibacteria group bacterium]